MLTLGTAPGDLYRTAQVAPHAFTVQVAPHAFLFVLKFGLVLWVAGLQNSDRNVQGMSVEADCEPDQQTGQDNNHSPKSRYALSLE